MSNRAFHPFVAGVLATCRRRRLLAPGDRVLAALSGGPDSVALVTVLAALRQAGCIGALSAAHVDHGLRSGSTEDGVFAAALCDELGVPIARLRVVVPPGNVQAQARRVRYRALRAEAARIGATRIATGHTRSDQAETVLLRLLRGAGARGLSGIPPRRGAIVRPLIDRSRAEVLAYLASSGRGWREDPTNSSLRYARNRVRHEILPALTRLAPAAVQALARTADLLRDDERALSREARVRATAPEVDRVRMLAEPIAVRRRIVRQRWRRATRGGGELSARHVEDVLALLRRRGPGRISLPGGVVARCRYGRFAIEAEVPATPSVEEVVMAGPGRYIVGDRSVLLVARRPELVPWPVLLRTRRPGDHFRPERGVGGKKLKSWLIDQKIPRERRDGLLVVASGSTVLALPELGVRAQEVGPDRAGLEVRIGAAGDV